MQIAEFSSQTSAGPMLCPPLEVTFKPVLRIRIRTDPHSFLDRWIRTRIRIGNMDLYQDLGGQNDPQNKENSNFEVMFSFEE
jgi:hypothetical protein